MHREGAPIGVERADFDRLVVVLHPDARLEPDAPRARDFDEREAGRLVSAERVRTIGHGEAAGAKEGRAMSPEEDADRAALRDRDVDDDVAHAFLGARERLLDRATATPYDHRRDAPPEGARSDVGRGQRGGRRALHERVVVVDARHRRPRERADDGRFARASGRGAPIGRGGDVAPMGREL